MQKTINNEIPEWVSKISEIVEETKKHEDKNE